MLSYQLGSFPLGHSEWLRLKFLTGRGSTRAVLAIAAVKRTPGLPERASLLCGSCFPVQGTLVPFPDFIGSCPFLVGTSQEAEVPTQGGG